jgi:hypothetical protein
MPTLDRIKVMLKYQIQKDFLDAVMAGTMLIQKHDPYLLTSPIWSSPRSVLSFGMADNLERFFRDGRYHTYHYERTAYPGSPDYWVIESADPEFDIPVSGVPASSSIPTVALDRLVVVSGQRIGLHAFGESSTVIEGMINVGDLILRDVFRDP